MPATAVLTSEQYLALPDEVDQSGNRVKDELIAGEIVRMPPPSRLHDWIKNRISRMLGRYLDANPQITLEPLVEMGAKVSERDTLVPDVSVVQRERVLGAGRIFQGAPDLAIEVVSPTDTAAHLKSKVDAYLQNGSKTVWVVYPDSRSVMIHSGDTARELKADQEIEDALLPGFSVPVSSFFDLT
jgi:Uma2 family endonuclease